MKLSNLTLQVIKISFSLYIVKKTVVFTLHQHFILNPLQPVSFFFFFCETKFEKLEKLSVLFQKKKKKKKKSRKCAEIGTEDHYEMNF